MMNVTGLWKEGVTGKGVISALVDDGLDYESDDLKPNFVSRRSMQVMPGVPLKEDRSMKLVHTTSTTTSPFQNQNYGTTSTELDVLERLPPLKTTFVVSG
jgi:subtilisin family serine protease